MIIEPSGDWSVFKQIFADHWDGFKQVNPRYHTWQRVGLAWAVYAHPFADPKVLERLAQGLSLPEVIRREAARPHAWKRREIV